MKNIASLVITITPDIQIKFGLIEMFNNFKNSSK